ncbi:ATP-binding protein [Streptomyces sp. SS1-1]|uniref:ATP-binding protein n=1 Tax=Streptomyces sp. SS1-1 TaxID=2651869 RepID=UPI001250937C|nr:ATP-binding protein [Streptomyces sp. SS1-1]
MTTDPDATAHPSFARPELRSPTHHFAMDFSSTRRGARLARHLCGARLDAWGVPYGSDPHEAATLVVAELCANAVRHGHVPGRDFRLRLLGRDTTVLVEVSDTRAERLPVLSALPEVLGGPDEVPEDDRDGGRGLLLVAALADGWGWCPRAEGGPGKTVWARLALPASFALIAPTLSPAPISPSMPRTLARLPGSAAARRSVTGSLRASPPPGQDSAGHF